MKNIGIYLFFIIAILVYSGIGNNSKADNNNVSYDSISIKRILNVNLYTLFIPTTNKFQDDPQALPTLKNGDPAPPSVLLGRTLPLDFSEEVALYLENVAKQVLGSNPQYKDLHMYITLRILPETGEISDIIFSVPSNSALCGVKPDDWKKIIKLIRENVKFTVNEAGKQLNFCPIWWYCKI